MTDSFDAIVGEAFKDDVLISYSSTRDLIVAFQKLIDAAETVHAMSVYEAIEAAHPWFKALGNNLALGRYLMEHREDSLDGPLYEQIIGAIKTGVPALRDWMREHQIDRIHHWTLTVYGTFEISTWTRGLKEPHAQVD